MRVILASLILVAAFASSAEATVLERIRDTATLKVGFREDARPFSFKNEVGEAAGYSVELCREVAARLKHSLGLATLTIKYQPVTAENRFEAVNRGDVDILCGATTATLSRRSLVDFSLPVFIDGASVLYRTDGPENFESLAGHRVGVRAGTTTEEALTKSLLAMSVAAEVVAVEDHSEGLRRLEAGDVSAYFADRVILHFLMTRSAKAESLRLSQRFFTHEPYALAMPRGDSNFRLAVDRALSRIYRDGSIKQIFSRGFGAEAEPSGLVQALFIISALPE